MVCAYLVRAKFRRQDGGAQVFEQPALRNNVANVRQIVQRNRFRAQQRCGHTRQRRVLGAAYGDAAFECVSAADAKFIHADRLE